MFSTCCVIFGICNDLLPHLWFSHADGLFNDPFRDSFHWNAVNDFNDLHHCAILHALLWYDLHNCEGFLRHSAMVSHVLFNNDLLMNSFVRVCVICSEIHSFGITLTFHWFRQRSVSLCLVNVGLLDHLIHIFICELLTQVFLQVSYNFARWLITTDNSVLCSRFATCWGTSPAVPRQSSPLGDRHQLVVTCSATMFVGGLVSWTVWVMRHCIMTSPVVAFVWATHGLPVVQAPVYRGCPCRDPLGCPPMPKQDDIGSRAPTLSGCAVLVVVDM